jgi:hypothetical protein
MIKIVIAFIFSFNILYSAPWSLNNVMKFTPDVLKGYNKIIDFENFEIRTNYIEPSAESNCWLQSYNIEVGDDYVVSSAFINFDKTDSNSWVDLKIKDSGNDSIISEKRFSDAGKIDLINVFNKNIYLYLETSGSDIRIYSYGITRKPEVVMTSNDLIILPSVLFYEETSLKIDFTLRFPAFLDIIIFDKFGRITDYVSENEFFKEGNNSRFWEPTGSHSKELVSGTHFIYFKVKSTDGKIVEITQKFIFVKN